MLSLKQEKKWIKVTLFSIISIVFFVSLYIVLRYNNYFLFGSLGKGNDDDVRYIRSAVTLLNKGMLTYHNVNTPTVFIMPGITFTLAFFIKLFGVLGGVSAFRVFQVVLQSVSILIIFYIARELFNSNVAIIACIIDALYLPEISTSGLILTEGIFKFLLLLLVLISILALKTKKIKFYIVGGLIWGLACLFRPTVLLFPAVFLFMWIKNRYSVKDIIKFTLITCTVFVTVMSPWWIRNYITFHEVIPLSQSTGNPFLQGTYIGYTPRLDDPEYLKASYLGNKAEMELGKRRFIAGFEKKPVQYFFWYTIGKTCYYWAAPCYFKNVLGVPFIPMVVFHALIILAGIIGIIISFRKRMNSIFAFLVMLYFNLIHLPYLTEARYSFPVMPFMIMFASYTCVCLYIKVLARKNLKLTQ